MIVVFFPLKKNSIQSANWVYILFYIIRLQSLINKHSSHWLLGFISNCCSKMQLDVSLQNTSSCECSAVEKRDCTLRMQMTPANRIFTLMHQTVTPRVTQLVFQEPFKASFYLDGTNEMFPV